MKTYIKLFFHSQEREKREKWELELARVIIDFPRKHIRICFCVHEEEGKPLPSLECMMFEFYSGGVPIATVIRKIASIWGFNTCFRLTEFICEKH